jgi:hypothetical protein
MGYDFFVILFLEYCSLPHDQVMSKSNDGEKDVQTMSASEIRTEMKTIGSKRWLHRRRKMLLARLADMKHTILSTDQTTNVVAPKAAGAQLGCAMTCITKPRCIRSHAPTACVPMDKVTKHLNPYGTVLNSSTSVVVSEQSDVQNLKKRKRADSDGEDSDNEHITPPFHAPQMDLDSEDYCSQCNIPMKLVPHRALMVCTQCGCISSYIDSTTNSMAYGEEIDFSQQYSYRRANHWKLAVAQLQAIENTEIKQDVLDKVLEELYARGILDPSGVTPKILREVLKKLKLRKCYDHIPQIYARITGIPPVRFTPEIEEQLRLMFIAIQEPFSKVAPVARKNFLSYKYLLHKVAELCGYDEILDFLSLLKGKDKLMRQDAIYKGICEQLNWQFIPSV